MPSSGKSRNASPVASVKSPMLNEPIYLINNNGIYYITLGVWEYYPSKIETVEQKEAYNLVAEHFNLASQNGTSPAVMLEIGQPPTMTSTTKPPQPAQVPTNPPLPKR